MLIKDIKHIRDNIYNLDISSEDLKEMLDIIHTTIGDIGIGINKLNTANFNEGLILRLLVTDVIKNYKDKLSERPVIFNFMFGGSRYSFYVGKVDQVNDMLDGYTYEYISPLDY